MWAKLRKLASLKKLTYFVIIFLVILCLYGFWIQNGPTTSNISKSDTGLCNHGPRDLLNEARAFSDSKIFSNSRTRQHALLFLQDTSSHSGKLILYLLQAARLKYHSQYGAVRNLPALIDNDKGRYAAIVFEDVDIYLQMSQWNREILDKYCVEYDVGVIFFVLTEKKKSSKTLDNEKMGPFPLTYATNLELKNSIINPDSAILRVTRAGEMVEGTIGHKWSVFYTNHSTYEVVTSASLVDSKDLRQRKIFGSHQSPILKYRPPTKKNVVSRFFNIFSNDKEHIDVLQPPSTTAQTGYYPTVLLDVGRYDQIRRVIFGNNLEFWMNKILFLDALSYLSNGKLSLPLERYMQVDIDDIFVSVAGTRMHSGDVTELVRFQKNMRKKVPGFSFLLGFSGKFYQRGGLPEEMEGDAEFFRESHNFLWFPHMWSHMQAHLFSNKSVLCDYMQPNVKFAKRHKFNVSSRYAVAPHHSGIFPVHEPLYDCWKEVWDIAYTSTEEYPNLRPDTKRRGFIYNGLKVLPRQTCGLFTHTNVYEKYPGGPKKLEAMIHGGQLFQTLLLNQFNIYMTHFSNYGSDRLALHVFDKVVDFTQCWTNLRLLQVPPSELAEKYFTEYPDEVDPVWTNPCADPRHLEIWAKSKSCDRLPKFVIVGPQKTGTTALHWFLQMHPDLVASKLNPETFEEIQFFNSANYLKGLDWYMDFFPMPNKQDETIFFEKSANYFSHSIVPRRLGALLPKAHIIILLVDPAKRAYSWYQHMRSHDDPTALNYSFYEVIKARKKSPPALLSLQTRCLLPGRYAEHIDTWMEFIPSQQMIFEDGEMLANNPIPVLQRLQKALGLPKIFNYEKSIKLDENKGFFCQVQENGKTKCLGKGKGRQYPDMSTKSRLYLAEYYKESNKRLLQILKDLRRPVPMWLIPDNSTVT